MIFRNAYKSIILGLMLTVAPSIGFAQLREEFEERKTTRIEAEELERKVAEEKKAAPKKYRLTSNIELSGGYDTNPRMTAIRKGDSSGQLKYALTFARMLFKGINFTFSYNFDGSAYSEFDQLSNLLNHMRFAFDKPINKHISIGTGYDFSSFYYPVAEESNFYFHKGFIYFKHNITKTIYHQINLEEGVKFYPQSLAYLNSTSTFTDNDRLDYRHAADYSISLPVNKSVSLRMRAKYSVNDSNAMFQDYHDYSSWDYTPSLTYKMTPKLSMNLSLTMTDKDYKERLVTNGTDQRSDRLYNLNVGLRYLINKKNTVSLGYGYNDSHSNDPTTEYTGTSFTCGYQYSF